MDDIPHDEEPRTPDSIEPAAEGDIPVAAFEEVDTDQIPATDIVFECPYCGKSLSIDQRGAGLVIACTQCQQMVTVPIPEGMELSDIDLPPEEQEAQLSNLRVMLGQTQRRIAELTEENTRLADQNEAFVRAAAARDRRLGEFRSLAASLGKVQAEAEDLLARLRKLLDEA